jgi:hypothetical protein
MTEELYQALVDGFPHGVMQKIPVVKLVGGKKVATANYKLLVSWENPPLPELFAYLSEHVADIEILFSWQGKNTQWYSVPALRLFPQFQVPLDWVEAFAEIEEESQQSESWWNYRCGIVSGPVVIAPVYRVAVHLK